MICMDFQKAFDTVSRDFRFHTLSSFGFGPSLQQKILLIPLQLKGESDKETRLSLLVHRSRQKFS